MNIMSTRLLLSCCAIFFLAGCRVVHETVQSEKRLHHSYWESTRSYEDLFQSPRAVSAEPLRQQVVGGIVSHHLFVGHEIARYYETLRLQSPSIVVVVGPNHFEQGEAAIQVTDRSFETPYGTLQVASDSVQYLKNRGIAEIEPLTFDNEHSISTHVAFVKRMFPRALLLPIALRAGTSHEQATALGVALDHLLPADALVLASVDFSHYQPPDVAAFHDDYSQAVIEQFAYEHVRNLELDSVPSIEALLTFLSARKAQHVAYTYHANSADFVVGSTPDVTTSYFFNAFTNGEALSSPFATLLFLGDTIIDRGVASIIGGNQDPLSTIRGKEDRFFWGATVTGLNLEGPITSAPKNEQKTVSFSFEDDVTFPLLKAMKVNVVSIANNHIDDAGSPGKEDTLTSLWKNNISAAGYPDPCVQMPIVHGSLAVCAFADLLDIERVTDAIRIARAQADYLVVSVHWGQEYAATPTDRQHLLAKAFIQAGADAVIGHGPHIQQSIEHIEGKPVLYSIGNFLFDQPDTNQSNGMAAALTFTVKNIEVRTFPLQTEGGKPRLR